VSRDLEEAAPKKPLPPPPKPELPPSLQGLDLGGLPVLDVFQVYSCLRSFSKQLFLSPFSLETFVAALLKGKCALGPFLSILVIACQHKYLNVNLCP
jgi:hypothetical protein